MIDFLMISTRVSKRGVTEIYPKFIIRNPSEHLMIRGGDFYAVWMEEKGLWSVSEQDAIDLIDKALDDYARQNGSRFEGGYRVMHLWDAESGMIDAWHKYCQRQMRDSFHTLDEKLIFANTKTTRTDYASKQLPYPLEKGDISAWDRLIGVLYDKTERHKIEWAIGSIVSGDSRKLQKFMVLYGAAGTGKSTVLNIIEQLFEGYTGVFNAKALGSSTDSFALEAFRASPLVAIQHDGDLSRIEDNTRLNSLVSHELMSVNEKYQKAYANRFKCFLFMGTNKPVRITDAKSGLIRRLIDVSPTGEKVKPQEYRQLMKRITFELGAIAHHCMEVYSSNPEAYDGYIPLNMLGASNDFYNFVMDSWAVFRKADETTLKAAWTMYKAYAEDAKMQHIYSQRAFKEELKNYFREYSEREVLPDGTRVRSYYRGFCAEKFEPEKPEEQEEKAAIPDWLVMTEQPSLLDAAYGDCPAQYATGAGTPRRNWQSVKTTLADLDTYKTHYAKMPKNLVVTDFDLKNEQGEKSLARNLEEAAKWPPTYAEVSKSGQGLHLHYLYEGDVGELSRLYEDGVEIKVFTGDASLRRKLTLCNNLPIATLTHGLPKKKDVKKIVNFTSIQSEKGLRRAVQRNLQKEIHPATKPSVDFIFKILEDAYADEGLSYDVSDMRNAVIAFAAHSTHNAPYCLQKAAQMRFCSKDRGEGVPNNDRPIVFYDVEVFPNLLLVNWKLAGEGKPVVRMINPKPSEVEELMRYRLIGFNCRRYDNHILYGRLMGYSNQQLYDLSQRIISGGKRGGDHFFGEAYNISYTDVYDFASAGNKKSLKKFEIELGLHHQELGLPWDKPVPEHLWPKVAEYCDNDVLATEAVFNHLQGDWLARQILAELAGMTVNDTTNSLTTRIIFDRVKKPQSEFNWRNLGEPVRELEAEVMRFLQTAAPEMMLAEHGDDSLLPWFPGYRYENGTSVYREEVVGEGGYVYAEPGMYGNVALLDVMSMHPHSVIAECLFGPRFTRRFKEIVDGRVSIKHEAWGELDNLLDGKLKPYVAKVQNGELSAKALADALKTAINSVYGLTSAAFENAFRDPRNRDNIVAKRGALFMVNLKHEVQARGFTVAHIKTDSIKIPDATPEIIQFVMDYGKTYGYTFEHEATYDKMCLVNDAVYIARYDTPEACLRKYGYVPGDVKKKAGKWTATGKQFAVPYVFKTLFTKEPIVFEDLCETFSVNGALYLDMNEALEDVTAQEKALAKALKDNKLSHEDWIDFQATGELPEHCDTASLAMNLKSLEEQIAAGHDYRFVGRVGQFTPILPGHGGGLLMRESGGRYGAATGSKGWRWIESTAINSLHAAGDNLPHLTEADIDRGYYEKLANDAIETISKYGDFEWFRSEDEYSPTA